MNTVLLPYRAVVSARFRALLQYRAAAFAGFATQLFWGLIRVMIFTAFYRSTTKTPPMPLPQLVSYLWLTQAMYALAMFGVDADVQGMIQNGTVAYEMLRPVDLYSLWYARALAARVAPTMLRAVPMFGAALLFLGMRPPPSVSAALAWGVATMGALLLVTALSVLLTISLLYTLSGEGLKRLVPAFTYMFSGILIPLPFLPAWTQPVVNFLPFRGVVDTPFRLWTGGIPLARLPGVLAHQLGWTFALVLCGRWLLARATRRLVVQGG